MKIDDKKIETRINLLEESVKFKLLDNEKEKFKEELIKFQKALKLLDTLDLEGVEEISTPFKVETSYLRDDNFVSNNSWNILSNSNNYVNDLIVLDEKSKK